MTPFPSSLTGQRAVICHRTDGATRGTELSSAVLQLQSCCACLGAHACSHPIPISSTWPWRDAHHPFWPPDQLYFWPSKLSGQRPGQILNKEASREPA